MILFSDFYNRIIKNRQIIFPAIENHSSLRPENNTTKALQLFLKCPDENETHCLPHYWKIHQEVSNAKKHKTFL